MKLINVTLFLDGQQKKENAAQNARDMRHGGMCHVKKDVGSSM